MIDVNHCLFLFHHTPPPGFGRTPLLLMSEADSKPHIVTVEDLSKIKLPLVTHSFSLLVEWFRNRSLPLPKMVVDLEIAQKLLVGRPKSDFDVQRPWDMSVMLHRFVPQRYDKKSVRVALATHLVKPSISKSENLRWMSAIATGLPVLWRDLIVELKTKGEFQRFIDVEVLSYNAMLKSEYQGIRINPERREGILHDLEKEYVSAHYQLAIEKGIDVDRAIEDIQYLSGYLNNPVLGIDEYLRPLELIDAREDIDPVCALLNTVVNARRSRNILLRSIGNDEEHCYPMFDTMGTVTGRILTVAPHLQHLKKKYRSIIQARDGQKLVYVDYSHFEPNIMASISNDSQLLGLCRAGNIYERMAVDLCGDATHRRTVKLMFLAYSYGKQISTLSDFLIGIHSRGKAENLIKKRFVPLFAGIELWKSSVVNELAMAGRIGTLHGNYRYRVKGGDLEAKERRWAISQVVQGTGSLILKKLINMLMTELPDVAILLPMHDALLVEVPEKTAAEVTEALLGCCRKAFSEVCPRVAPAVSEKAFCE